MNGEESEAKKIVSALQARERSELKLGPESPKEPALMPPVDETTDEIGSGTRDEDQNSDVTQYSEDEDEEREMVARAGAKEKLEQEPEPPKRRSGRLKESK